MSQPSRVTQVLGIPSLNASQPLPRSPSKNTPRRGVQTLVRSHPRPVGTDDQAGAQRFACNSVLNLHNHLKGQVLSLQNRKRRLREAKDLSKVGLRLQPRQA